MPIYIQYGDIKGDVTAEGHEGSAGWVEINSFQFGVGRGIASPTGGSTDREASAPSVSEVVVTKSMDNSSYRWLEEALWGEGVKATIHFVKTDKDKLETYAEYILGDCMVSGYSVSSGGDRPTEMGAKNEGVPPARTGYNIAKGAKGTVA
jgi:type VI secretion system secreted protein Hcp